jgi:uncharacterized membrane protein YkvA (DUF1232 family)
MSRFDRLRTRAHQLKRETRALYYAYRDPRTPLYAKLFAAVVVAYAFSPIDLIPDFIPVLGYLDDLILIPLGVALALRMISPEVMVDARARAAEMEGKPTSWIAAALIVVVWVALAALGILVIGRAAGIIE